MKNLVLTGMMGCGKTTCGRALAEKLGRPFVDTDEVVEARAGLTIPEIFARDGEQGFRDLESAVARELAAETGAVVATGGGIILRPENRAALKKGGLVFFLNRPAADIFSSVSMAGRPLGQGGEAQFLQRFRDREGLYRGMADEVIDLFTSPAVTVEEILRLLRARGEL